LRVSQVSFVGDHEIDELSDAGIMSAGSVIGWDDQIG